jgi:hypothetical protein
MTTMATQKTTNSSKTKLTSQESESDLNLTQKPSVQYGLSIAIGVIIILLLATTYYLGIFRY